MPFINLHILFVLSNNKFLEIESLPMRKDIFVFDFIK